MEFTISLHSHTQYNSQRKGYVSEQSSETCWATSTLYSVKVYVFTNKKILICAQKHLEGRNSFLLYQEKPCYQFFLHTI